MTAHDLKATVARVLNRTHLSSGRLIIGVSGGPDSVALLLSLAELRHRYDLILHVAHFDHAQRSDSADDAAWVAGLAKNLGIDLTMSRADEKLAGQNHRLLSEVALRRARYRFFHSVSARIGATAVLVGHTQDDQVETRLLHFIRGSGLPGLRGMAEDSLVSVTGDAPVRVVRPFLDVSRRLTEDYCSHRGIEPRRDSTNLDENYARNRVRHRVVPVMNSLNSRLPAALNRLGRTAADTEAFVESELDRRLPRLATITPRAWTIDRQEWRSLHPALKRALLRRAAEELLPFHDVGAEAIETALAAADTGRTGCKITWPNGRLVVVDRHQIQISRDTGDLKVSQPIRLRCDQPTVVDLAGVVSTEWLARPGSLWNHAGRPILRTSLRMAMCIDKVGDHWHLDLDRDKIGSTLELQLRSRLDGDRLFPEGMLGHKKLQDLFVDSHVPERWRDQVPLVTSQAGIAWVVGLRRDRRFMADAESTSVLCVSVVPEIIKGDEECTDLATI